MTPFAEIITDYALPVIDDVRLNEMLALNPAQFFRKMWGYLCPAIPLFNRPPTMVQYLQKDMTEPRFDDHEWISDEKSLDETTEIETGMTGFDLFSCVIRTEDKAGNVSLTPYSEATYDTESGVVTFPIQTETNVEYMMDFYADGSFAPDLSPRQMRLLGLAIAVVWDERFTRNWLNIQMKVHDSSFNTVNESNYLKETTSRLSKTREMFFGELLKYEQDCAYAKTVRNGQYLFDLV